MNGGALAQVNRRTGVLALTCNSEGEAMCNHTGPVMAMLLSLILTIAPVAVWAQNSEEPAHARFHVGAVRFSPTIRLSNAGWDSNVFYRHHDNRPVGDMTATLTPALDASIRLTRVRVNAHHQFDLY